MRIAFITPEYVTEESYSGGLANYLGRVTTAFADQGHDVHVFTKSYAANEVIDFKGVTVHRVIPLWDKKMRLDRVDRLAPRSLYAPYQDLKAAWSLWRRWKKANRQQRFDLVQVANVLAVGLFFRRVKRLPVVTRLSSHRPTWDTAAGVELTRAVKARWWMEKTAIGGIKHAYAPSRFVAELSEKDYGLRNVRVIETPFHHEEPVANLTDYRQYCDGQDYILFFGRMTQMKGVHLLAEALPALMQKHPEMQAVFIGGQAIAPDGGQMHQYILDRTSAVRDRVIVLDSMRHDRLYPIVQHARVVAIPSLIDNLPNTCLEAMALGKMVVATTGSCFEQLIVDRESGLLCQPADIVDLRATLDFAWNLSAEDRQRIERAAQARIAELHPAIKIPELLDYFRELTGTQRAG